MHSRGLIFLLRTVTWGLIWGAAWLASPPVAAALVTEPNGVVVPLDSMNGEVQLYTFFANQGEAIDWQADAHDKPDTFSPLCDFTATFVLKESGSTLGVGWYNVIPGATTPPAATDIHQIIAPGSPVGTVVASADIRTDPNYLGGDIGFALMRTPPYFSESKWSTICDQLFCASTPGPWFIALSYKSANNPNAWYMAFEDGDVTNASWDNDGDFNDYVFLFTGIACSGAGQPCQPDGGVGICAPGLTECDKAGQLSCKQLISPQTEKCNGVDDDCDGEIDEGDDICPENEVCVRGTCVPYCGVEFPCRSPTVCENRVCVHPKCVGVTCEKGQACIEGKCLAPCDGIKCPAPLTCRVGRCVDPCEGIDCGAGLVCQQSVCVTPCGCQSCAAGTSCRLSDGLCVEDACLQVACNTGAYCSAGNCVDACKEAVCPKGQTCKAGDCADGGESAGSNDGGRSAGPNDGGSSEGGYSSADAGAKDGAGVGGTGARRAATRTYSGSGPVDSCGCRVLAGSAGPSGAGAIWASAAICLLFRRKRRLR